MKGTPEEQSLERLLRHRYGELAQGRTATGMLPSAAIDLLLTVLFAVAWVRTRDA